MKDVMVSLCGADVLGFVVVECVFVSRRRGNYRASDRGRILRIYDTKNALEMM
jgi:hypothetical protein